MKHADNLRMIAGEVGDDDAARALISAADYLEAHENLANECRRKVEIQIALRVEAQARAARLARDARR